MKIAIVYFSKTETTKDMAKVIAEGIGFVEGIEVKLFDLENVDVEYLKESKAVIFGTPTYMANSCFQLEKWFYDNSKVNLGGKLGAVFATANYPQGGADTAISGIINHLLVKGMLVYSSGGALGQPFIHIGAVALRDRLEEGKNLFRVFGKRIAEKTVELFKE